MLLKRPDVTLRYHYKLDSAGRIVTFEKNKGGLPNLFDMVPYDKSAGDPTAMHVVKAAESIEKIYPEIHFEFTQADDTIEYTASLRESK